MIETIVPARVWEERPKALFTDLARRPWVERAGVARIMVLHVAVLNDNLEAIRPCPPGARLVE